MGVRAGRLWRQFRYVCLAWPMSALRCTIHVDAMSIVPPDRWTQGVLRRGARKQLSFTVARIELSTYIMAPPERCFDLARSVDVHVQSTAATREVAVAGKTAGLLELGDEITWRARHFGIRQSLSSRITAYDRPRWFQDTMLRGAFRQLRHDHIFDAVEGGTRMRDVFEFSAPLGVLGRIAERLFLTAYLRRFLEARNRVLKTVAESERWQQFVPPVS